MIDRERLWAAINDYAAACGGEPHINTLGNTKRQAAVVAVERALVGDVCDDVAWYGTYRGTEGDPRQAGWCATCGREVWDGDPWGHRVSK